MSVAAAAADPTSLPSAGGEVLTAAAQLTETLRVANAPPASLEASVVDPVTGDASAPCALVAAVAATGCCGETPTTWSPQRPILIVPGIAGTYAVKGAEDEWLTRRGIAPDKIRIDPLVHVYDDLIQTLVNVGYKTDQSLFVVNYDWRMMPGPQDQAFDGKISGLTAASITDSTFSYGVDYLGYYLKKAAEAWKQHKGAYPDAVDVVTHSTGGLVARVYIQSDAYGRSSGTTLLPKVHDLIMMGVPNRGASKAWNILHDNWGVEVAYQIVLSKIVNNAYEKYLAGTVIDGPDYKIDVKTGKLNHEAFIAKYAPTIRGLLATYDFLSDGSQTNGQYTFRDVDSDPAQRNWLTLDLNDGLDLEYQLSNLSATNTYTQPDGKVRKPTGFIDALTGDAVVVYSELVNTPTNVVTRTGPTGALNQVVQFDQFLGSVPGTDQKWYEDLSLEKGGDGTVPLASSRDLFKAGSSAKLKLINLAFDGTETGVEQLDHLGLMWAKVGQEAVLDQLDGLTYTDQKISRYSASNPAGSLDAAIKAGIIDLDDIVQETSLTDLVRGVLLQGFTRLSVWAQEADLNPLLTKGLALLNQSTGSMISLTRFVDVITGPIVKGLADAGVTSEDVLGWLRNISAPEGFDLTVNPAVTLGGLTAASFFGTALKDVVQRTELVFHTEGVLSRTFNAPVDLGTDGLNNKIVLGADATVQATAALNYAFSFGADLRDDPSLKAEDRFFIRFDRLDISVKVDVADLNAGLRVGFIGAGIAGGSVKLQAGVGVKFTDPDKNGRITLRELLGTSEVPGSGLPALVSLTAKGSFCAVLPIQATLGTFTVGGASTAICFSDPELFDLTAPTFQVSGDFSKLLNFKDIEYTMLEAALQQLPQVLRGLNDLLRKALPDVEFLDFTELTDIADKFSQALRNLKSWGVEFTTANVLTATLKEALAGQGLGDYLDVAVTDKEIQVGLKLRHDFSNDAVRVNFRREISKGLLSAGVRLEGTVKVEGFIEAALGVGIALHPVDANVVYLLGGGKSHLRIGLEISTPKPIVAEAWLGYLKIGINNGQIKVGALTPDATKPDGTKATASLDLNDPNKDGKITLTEIATNLVGENGVLTGITLLGKASVECTVLAKEGVSNTGGKLGVYWRDLRNLSTIEYDTSGLDAFFEAAQNFSSDLIISGILEFANWLGDRLLSDPVFARRLPWVNVSVHEAFDGLMGYLADFFRGIDSSDDNASAFDAAIQAARNAIVERINSQLEETGITLGTFTVQPQVAGNWHLPAQGRFRYLLSFQASLGTDYAFKLGPDFLSLDGTLRAQLTVRFNIEFGYNAEDGFYLVDRQKAHPTEAPELQLTGVVGATGVNFQGSLGPNGIFACGVKNGSATGTASLGLDLKDPDGAADANGLIPMGQLVAALQPTFDATGDLTLPLGFRLFNGGPGVTTTFQAYWSSANPGDIYFGKRSEGKNSTQIVDGFSTVKFELGEFFTKMIGPVLRTIQDYNILGDQGMQVLGLLYKKLPVLDMSVLDMLQKVRLPGEWSKINDLADILNQPILRFLNELFRIVSAFPKDGVFAELNLSDFIEGETKPANSSEGSELGGTAELPHDGVGLQSVGSASEIGNFLTDLIKTLKEYGVEIPILGIENKFKDNSVTALISRIASNVVKLIVGPGADNSNDIDLIRWTPDPIKWSIPIDLPDIPLFSYGVAGVMALEADLAVSGTVDIFIGPQFGISSRIFYETEHQGLLKLLDALWIGDNKKGNTDQFEMGVSFGIEGKAFGTATVYGVGLVSVGGGLNIHTTLGLDIADIRPSKADDKPIDVFYDKDGKGWVRVGRTEEGGDGRIFLGEIERLAQYYTLPCILTLGGKLEPDFVLQLKALCVPGLGCAFNQRFPIPLPALVNWEYPCHISQPDIANIIGDTLTMVVAPAGTGTVVDPGCCGLSTGVITDSEEADIRVSLVYGKDGTVTGLRLQRASNQHNEVEDFSFIDPNAGALIDGKQIGGYIGGGKVKKLVLYGTNGKNTITVDPDITYYGGGNTQFTLETVVVHAGDGPDVIYFGKFDAAKSSLKNTQLFGEGGVDQVNGTPFADLIYGGLGDDILLNGYEGNDEIHGDEGNDVISGGPGDDRLYGGTGNDSIFGQENNDTIEGNAGNDLIQAGPGNDGVRGGDGDDTIEGDVGDDRLDGELGNDVLIGDLGKVEYANGRLSRIASDQDNLRGNDTINGGAGTDWIVGGGGDDTIDGGEDDDYVLGDTGDLTFATDGSVTRIAATAAAIGKDQIQGAAGNDILLGGADEDWMEGGDGGDVLVADLGTVTLTGGAVSSIMPTESAEVASNVLFGGPGNDFALGGAGADEIHGGAGADFVAGDAMSVEFTDGGASYYAIERETGRSANDLLFGDEGSDVLVGGYGADRIYGGDGNNANLADTTDYILGGTGSVRFRAGAITQLYSRDVNTGSDDLRAGDADQIQGNAGADDIIGGSGNDSIDGGPGDDWVFGDVTHLDYTASGLRLPKPLFEFIGVQPQARWNDIVHGGPDNDLIYGQEGEDELYGDDGADEIHGNLLADRIWGGNGDDRLYGEEAGDVIRGDDGNDTVLGGQDADVIYGGAGDDNLSGNQDADRLYGGLGEDTMFGFASEETGDDQTPDYLFGEEGDDTLSGNGGDDQLDGGSGADVLDGGPGNDLLVAGTGIGDRLYGGDGDDLIVGSDEGMDTGPDPAMLQPAGDYIDGGAGADQILALGGADVIYGGSGNDHIENGTGADLANGGPGEDWIYAGPGLGDTIYGDADNDSLYGSHEGNDTLYGGTGNDRIYGQGGADVLRGEAGDDYLNGGADVDRLYGGDGNDELDGGGGAGDQSFGEAGSDVIYGSDDGADSIDGGAGDDLVFGRGGNDLIAGGPGNDILHGGPGDDVLSGNDDSDLLLGEAGHDTLYGNSASIPGAASEVDYLYGDFGTNRNEAGSGNDRLLAGAGNDLLFGEGGADQINPGTGNSVVLDYGLGKGSTPDVYVTPTPTPSPALVAGVNLITVTASLPTGNIDAGRWSELAGSATGLGLSGHPGLALDPTVAVSAAGEVYAAWADVRNGNFEIYVARFTDSQGWHELGGSASGGGISRTLGSSRRPGLAFTAQNQPIVVWTEFSGGTSNIAGAVWSPTANNGAGAWVALGNSLSTGGISGTGAADWASVVTTSAGPVVAWLDSSQGVANAYAKVYNGSTWQPLGSSSSGAGVSLATRGVRDLALATDGVGVALAWTQTINGVDQVCLREYRNGAWRALGTSASGNGVSSRSFTNANPTLAYLNGSLFVAWQGTTSTGLSEVYAAQWTGSAWKTLGGESAGASGVSLTGGYASMPRLAAQGGELFLAWADDRRQSRTGNETALYTRQWNGVTFAEEIPGDASAHGVSLTSTLPDTLALFVGSDGLPTLIWGERAQTNIRVYLRQNRFSAFGKVLVANEAAGTTVQQLLDSNHFVKGDLIVVKGIHSSGFTVGWDDSGVLIYGAPDSRVDGLVTLQGTDDVVLQRLTLNGGLTLSGGNRAVIRDNTVSGAGILVSGAVRPRLAHNQVYAETGLSLSGSFQDVIVEYNELVGTKTGLLIKGTSVANVHVRQNRISGKTTGLSIEAPANGLISGNDVAMDGAGQGVNVAAAFGGTIDHNRIHGANVGVVYSATANLSGNEVFGNTTGIVATINSPQGGLGFVGGGEPNQIFGNATGVQLTGYMQGQHVFGNTTGVTGTGFLGPLEALDRANLIELNQTGVSFKGRIQFNQIARNEVGLAAAADTEVYHNVFYRNTRVALAINSQSNIQVFQNTFYAAVGDNLRIEAGASNVEVLNNIFWAESGYDLFVGNDSRTGFYSDYNDLYAGSTGKLVFWAVDFTDLLDWQADVARFDLHSSGRTGVNPGRSRPQFYSLARDDFRTFDLAASQRFSSPTVDAGAAFVDKVLLLVDYRNLLANPGFELGLTNWTTNPEAALQTRLPAPYAGTQYYFAGDKAVGWAEQTISIAASGFTAAQIDSLDYVAVFGGRVRSEPESVPDSGSITLTFLDGTGKPVGSATTLYATNATDRWELVGSRVVVPGNARSIRFRFEAVRQSETDNDSFLDDAFLYLLDSTVAPDQGAFGHTEFESAQSREPHLALRTPDLYVDWERDLPHTVLWDSFGNTQDLQVRVDLWQEGPNGPAFFTTLSAGTQDNGAFTWIPANFGVDFGTLKWRVMISLVGDGRVLDRSAEVFAAPENTHTYYVNDASTTNDEYCRAAGNNRNTGKLPSTPKPSPVNVLRIYSLGATDTLYVDHGTYRLHHTILISNTVGIGNDEGFVFTGPTASSRTALFQFANPMDMMPMIELDKGDYMTLSYLKAINGGIGLWVHGGTDNLWASHLTFTGQKTDGILIDKGSSVISLEDFVSAENGDHGVLVWGTIETMVLGQVYGNGGIGVRIDQVQPGLVDSLIVHDNGDDGLYVRGPLTISHCTVYGQSSEDAAGIGIYWNASAVQNVVYGNTVGISASLDSSPNGVRNNRVYANTQTGIASWGYFDLRENVIYSNGIGLDLGSGYSGLVVNNLIYANAQLGVRIIASRQEGAVLRNNTVYETVAGCVRLERGARNITLRNNIFRTQSGVALDVATDSQSGFTSDYNLFFIAGSGAVGSWQATRQVVLADWQNASFGDGASFAQDPLFVSPTGVDGVLGYASVDRDGRDDDFHLQSKFGSYQDGALAPVIQKATGLPVALVGIELQDAQQSPGIDRGDPATGVGLEPGPNGGYVNLGAYGGTVQASKSPAEYVLVLRPDGGELLPAQRQFAIQWRSQDKLGTVNIELRQVGGASPVLMIATGVANTGEFIWTVPNTVSPGGNYLIRVIRGSISDTSNAPFTISGQITHYYVNDGTVEPGDWTTATGSDANSGLAPNAPKASIRALLETYKLGPGDVIRVDAGSYTLSANILITAADAGVTIEGYNDSRYPTRRALLNRANTSSSSSVFQLTGADHVTLSHLALTGAYTGIYLPASSNSTDVTIRNCEVFGMVSAGIDIRSSNDRATVDGNVVYGRAAGSTASPMDYGISAEAADVQVLDNQVRDCQYDGISVKGARALVSGNESYGNGFSGIVGWYSGNTNDLITVRGNWVHDNGDYGIQLRSKAWAVENTVFNQNQDGAVGIYLTGSCLAARNVVYDNVVGIAAALTNGSLIEGNRVYHNSKIGIRSSAQDTIRGNRIYNNGTGLQVDSSADADVENNLIYANSAEGVLISGAQVSLRFIGNTVYQINAVGLKLDGRLREILVENNIFWNAGGWVMGVSRESEPTLRSDYNLFFLTGGGKVAQWEGRDLTRWIDWFYELGFDPHGLEGDPQWVDPNGADNLLGFDAASQRDGGADDDFHVLPGSPAIDRGNPGRCFLAEPQPNGGRVNLGAYGNTPEAAPSPAALVQVLSPNGWEKFEAGQSMSVEWRAYGLGSANLIALINTGGSQQDLWIADRYRVDGSRSSSTDPNIDLTKVSNPAPVEVYRSYALAEDGVGQGLRWDLPLPDGPYTVRLHFLDPNYSQSGQRLFDIRLQDTVVAARYDIAAASGGVRKAVAREFTVTTKNGAGLKLELVNQTRVGALLCGIEIWSANSSPVNAPTFMVEFSPNNGMVWQSVATASTDRFGRGQVAWTVGQTLADNSALLRVTVKEQPQVLDVSDSGFTVANPGAHFYVNDGAVAAGDWTTAVGDNRNSGKDSGHPMASLGALLRAYTLHAGDTVHIDAGQYAVLSNTVLSAAHSGVVIEGYHAAQYPDRKAILDRGNTTTGSYLFDLQGTQNVTLSYLSLTGANIGIITDANCGGVRLSHNLVFGHTAYGVQVLQPQTAVRIDGNKVFSNTKGGLNLSGLVQLDDNEVYDHNSADGVGVNLTGEVQAMGNVIYGNQVGAALHGPVNFRDNRVFNNAAAAIDVENGTSDARGFVVSGNQVYGNATGIRFDGPTGSGFLRNNIVYGSSREEILVASRMTGIELLNNTLVVNGGVGVRVINDASDVRLRNNIICVSAGWALSVAATAEVGFASDYNLFQFTGTGKLAQWEGQEIGRRADWFFALGFDRNSLEADPQFVDPDGADNLLGFDRPSGRDGGADDDFHVRSGSPAVDRGDPASYFLLEPQPNGGRANLGAYGNTSEATLSPMAVVQILNPNGLEKLEVGHSIPIDWRLFGPWGQRIVTLINTGGSTVGNWVTDEFAAGVWQRRTIGDAVDLSRVAQPGPAELYDSYFIGKGGVGESLRWTLPVPDGQYSVRLHFVEPVEDSVGDRVFDIQLQGTVVVPGFDIVKLAGGPKRAITQTVNASVSAGTGLQLVLRNKTSAAAVISAIEIVESTGANVTVPLAIIEFSPDDGVHWQWVSDNLSADRYGQGSCVWTPLSETNGNVGRFRIRFEPPNTATDISDGGFLVVNSGRDYYINDANYVAGDWTSAAGNNLFGGKDPAHPMSSLFALLQAYDLDAGDVIHIDAGDYRILQDISLTAQDSGVVIEGFASAAYPLRRALLDRANSGTGRTVLNLAGARQVTLRHLAIKGADTGIFADRGAGSLELTIDQCEIFSNRYYGIFLMEGNDQAVVKDSRIYGVKGGQDWMRQYTGVEIRSSRALISGNQVFDAGNEGMVISGAGSKVLNNEVYGNSSGIRAFSTDSGDAIRVEGNRVHDNIGTGVSAGGNVEVVNNEVFNHAGTNQSAIYVSGEGWVNGNRVYLNYRGILSLGGILEGNRVFANQKEGIRADGESIVRGNKIYSNAVGIECSEGFRGRIESNIIYSNTDAGIRMNTNTGNTVVVRNNTIIQPVGDAVRLTVLPKTLDLHNNILWVGAGYGLYLATGNATGLVSDYNLFYKKADPNAHLAFLNQTNFDSLGNWQTGTGLDAHSLVNDPLFVDPDGADNILGYQAANNGVDGGADDNYGLSKGSPAIDRGNVWAAPPADATGSARTDDPGTPNLGTPEYSAALLSGSNFSRGGVAQKWRADRSYWKLSLPFGFTFYGKTYDTAYVSSRGFVDLNEQHVWDDASSTSTLTSRLRVAPCWDTVSTDGTSDDIFVDTSVNGQITIRWDGTLDRNGSDLNFAVTLFADGRMRFDYGPGNVGLTPTVGISSGDSEHFLALSYSNQATLTNARSLEITLTTAAGFVDLGPYEFRGSSLDTTPPKVTGSTPVSVHQGGTAAGIVDRLRITFSEPISAIDANSPANYELRDAGLNGRFGDTDDLVYPLVPHCPPGSVAVDLAVADGALASGQYRLTLRGSLSFHDLSGLQLDGDANGQAGGDYVRVFWVDNRVPRVVAALINDGAPQRSHISSIAVTFDTNVAASLDLDDFTLLNRDTGIPASRQGMQLTYDAARNQARLSFAGMPGGALPAGAYTLTLSATGVANALGAPMAGDYVLEFYARPGDATGDGVTNDLDLYGVWQNLMKPMAQRDLRYDLNGDGQVTADDLNVVKSNYATSSKGLASAADQGASSASSERASLGLPPGAAFPALLPRPVRTLSMSAVGPLPAFALDDPQPSFYSRELRVNGLWAGCFGESDGTEGVTPLTLLPSWRQFKSPYRV